MLKLRPHHILDIVRNIGNNKEIIPHSYGHNQHIITKMIIENIDQSCVLVIENDDICGPCIHLQPNNTCNDVLHQLDIPKSKQEYNDNLDTAILSLLHIEPGTVIPISKYLKLVSNNLESIIEICTHPKENKELRITGMVKGLHTLLLKALT